MLFDPGRHEPLLELEWDAARARETVRAIVEDLEETLGSGIAMTVVSRPCVLPPCSKTTLLTGPKTSEPRVPAERICSSSGAMGPQA